MHNMHIIRSMEFRHCAPYLFCLALLILFVLFLNIKTNILYQAYGISPPFERSIIFDEQNEWINMVNNTKVNNSDPSTDILGISYLSSGEFLNSTFWLSGSFPGDLNVAKQSYGIAIDVDFDFLPDFRIEYQKSQNQSWSKVYRELEPLNNTLFQSGNFNRFYVVDYNSPEDDAFIKEPQYVSLSFDLDAIGAPKQYQFYYYTEVRNDTSVVVDDFTQWSAIPPPEVMLSLTPASFEIRPGEEKIININVNSTTGYEPQIKLFAKNTTELALHLDMANFSVPAFGIIAKPLSVRASETASPSTSKIDIKSHSSIPPKTVYTSNTADVTPNDNPHLMSQDVTPNETETRTQISILSVEVKKPYTLLENLSNFNESVISPISGVWTFLIGVLTVSIPLVLRFYRNKIKNKPQRTNNSKIS
jgi:hypothetical protein